MAKDNSQELPEVDGTYDVPGHPNLRLKVIVHKGKHVKPSPTPIPACTVSDPDSVAEVGLGGWHLPSSWTYSLNIGSAPAGIRSNLPVIAQNSFTIRSGNTESVARAGTGAIVALTNAQSDLKSANDTITQLKTQISTLQGADDSEKETITQLQDQLTALESQLSEAAKNAAQPIQFHNQWAKIAYSVFQALNG